MRNDVTRGGHVLAAGAAGLLAVLLVGGCGSEPAAPPGPSVIVPGGPDEPAQVLPEGEASQRRVPDPTSPTDVAFVAAMVPHHRQALEMAALAPTRAAEPQVLAMADRIADTQGPEIAVMEAWLARQDPALGGGHGHDSGHDGELHPGMATEAQLAELGAASGPAFDDLFLQLMIVHHQGAVQMAQQAQVSGTDVLALQFADDVNVTQSVEIQRMRELLPA